MRFKKGQFQGKPQLLRNIVPYINKRYYRYAIIFTEDSLYRYENAADNDDWRKACGVTFNRLDNHELCAMVAFRCNFEKRTMSISPYYHDNYSKSWVGGGGNYKDPNNKREGLSKDNIIEVSLMQRIVVVMIVSDTEIVYRFYDNNNNLLLEHIGAFKCSKVLSWEIQPWFGGTLPANKDLSFELEFL